MHALQNEPPALPARHANRTQCPPCVRQPEVPQQSFPHATHMPFAHAGVFPPHVFPHIPQLFASLFVSVQAGPPSTMQMLWPILQQRPCMHDSVIAQLFPHIPQLF